MLSKKDWQAIDKEFESYRDFCRQKQKDKDDCCAEIERLENEVALEKHKLTESEKVWLKAIDTAWNDAIDAAAKSVEYSWGMSVRDAASAIRALKRNQS